MYDLLCVLLLSNSLCLMDTMDDFMLNLEMLYKKHEAGITLCAVMFCLAVSLLVYVYMGLPRKTEVSDYEVIDSRSYLDKAEYKDGAINLVGWFFVGSQDLRMQMKKEIVLRNSTSGNSYSYPVQYLNRLDVTKLFMKAFPKTFQSDKYSRAGFMTQINTRFIEDGIYKIYIGYVYNNKKFISDLKREIVIK